jgi:hypothetical protein
LYEFFSYSKKIYPPFGLRVVGKKKKKVTGGGGGGGKIYSY